VSNFLERNNPKSKSKKELICIKVSTHVQIKLLIRLLKTTINQLSLLINLDYYISFVFIIIELNCNALMAKCTSLYMGILINCCCCCCCHLGSESLALLIEGHN